MHFDKEITLQYVDARTIRVGAKMKVSPSNNEKNVLMKIKSFFKKAVSQVVNFVTIDLIVDQVKENGIAIRHGGGIGTELLVEGAMNYLKRNMPQYRNVVEEQGGGVLMVHLDGIREIKRVCEQVSIDGISFESDSIVVVATMKDSNRDL